VAQGKITSMKRLMSLITPLLFFTTTIAAANEGILGKWVTEEGKAHVVISECDPGLCGKIIWIKELTYPVDDEKGMAGEIRIDRENPDPTLQNRPLIGLQILRGFKTQNGNEWEEGEIYDPENGNTYKCKMKLSDPSTLNVRGYIGFSWIGRTTVWTKQKQKQTESKRDSTHEQIDEVS